MYNRIDLPLSPSLVTGLLAVAPWLMLAVITMAITLAGTWQAALLLPLLATGARSRWRRCGRLSHPQAIRRLSTRGPRLSVTLADGSEEEVGVCAGSRIGGGYLLLGLTGVGTGRHYTAILVPGATGGNAGEDALRRLRVWLRLMPEPPPPVTTAWYRNSLQRFWPGGKTHDH